MATENRKILDDTGRMAQASGQANLFDDAWEPASEPEGGVFTIGHSTRTLQELIGVLRHYRIQRLVDIRHFPGSRHNPQFQKATMEPALAGQGIEYVWLERLGGYREGGYTAYMETEAFRFGIAELEALAREQRTCLLCAERKWYKCHRRGVADVLAARGWPVMHIYDEGRAESHRDKDNTIQCD